MAAAYRSHQGTTYASRTNTTINKPAGVVAGDELRLYFLKSGGNAAAASVAPTWPSGWTVIEGPTIASQSGSPNLFSVAAWLLRKRAGGSEPASYTVTHSSASSDGVIVAVSGGEDADGQATSNSGNGTGNVTVPGVTTVGSACWIGTFWHNWQLWGSGDPPTGTTPTFTQRQDSASSIIYLADGVLAAAGATGVKTKDSDNTTADDGWASMLVAIESAASGSTAPTDGASRAAVRSTAVATCVSTNRGRSAASVLDRAVSVIRAAIGAAARAAARAAAAWTSAPQVSGRIGEASTTRGAVQGAPQVSALSRDVARATSSFLALPGASTLTWDTIRDSSIITVLPSAVAGLSRPAARSRVATDVATGIVEAIGSIIGSTGSESGTADDEKDKAFDGDFTTFFSAANATGDWLGKDLGSPGVVKKIAFAVRRSDSAASHEAAYEQRIWGGKFQISSAADFSSDVTDIYEVPSNQTLHSLRWYFVEIAGAAAKQYVRYLGPTGARCNIAGFRIFIDVGGPTDVKPAPPMPYPNGGRFPFVAHPPSVTDPQWTSSAITHYRTDGTTPTESDPVFTLPFTPDLSGGSVRLTLRNFDHSLATPESDVVTTRYYHPYGFKTPATGDDKWYDTAGNSLEAHSGEWMTGPGGDLIRIGGRLRWFGSSCNFYNDMNIGGGGKDANGVSGVHEYASADLYPGDIWNWDEIGNIIQVPSSWKYVVRTHCKFNAASGKYKMHMFAYSTNRLNDRYLVFENTAIDGIGNWTNLFPSGIFMDGIGGWDANIHLNRAAPPVCFKAYNTEGGGEVNVTELDADYEDSAAGPFDTDTGNREGVAMCEVQASHGESETVGLYTSHPIYYDSGGATSFLPRHRLALTPQGTYTTADGGGFANSMASDPVGTEFNAQSTCVFRLPGVGPVWMADWWDDDDMANSYPVFEPIGIYIAQLSVWDTSYFDVPVNTVADGLAYCFENDELNAAAPVDSVLGTVATKIGTSKSFGIEKRVQSTDAAVAFTVADSSQVRLGPDSYFHSCMFSLNSLSGTPIFLAKDDFGSNREFGYYVTGGNLHAYATINGSLFDIDLGAISANTFHIAHQYFDEDTQTFGGAKNGNWAGRVEVDATGDASGPLNGTAVLSFNHASGRAAGSIGQTLLCKGVSATQQNVEALWNDGKFLHKSFFQGAAGPLLAYGQSMTVASGVISAKSIAVARGREHASDLSAALSNFGFAFATARSLASERSQAAPAASALPSTNDRASTWDRGGQMISTAAQTGRSLEAASDRARVPSVTTLLVGRDWAAESSRVAESVHVAIIGSDRVASLSRLQSNTAAQVHGLTREAAAIRASGITFVPAFIRARATITIGPAVTARVRIGKSTRA